MNRYKIKVLACIALATSLFFQPLSYTLKVNATVINDKNTQYNNESTSVRQAIVDKAWTLLGIEYVYGGNDPTKGFDAPGLTQYIYKNISNINIGRTTWAQSQVGTRVSQDDLKIGDLVFTHFGNHVGIYVGDNQYINSPMPGQTVSVSPIDNFFTGISILDSYADIPDANLLKQLNKAINGTESLDAIQKSTLNNLTGSINIEGTIGDLKGIEELTNIDNLTIISTNLHNIYSDNFKTLSILKTLKIDGSISSVNSNLFNSLTNLESLDLSNNTISDFNLDSIKNSNKLVKLVLANNNLSSFSGDTEISNIKYLDLSNNRFYNASSLSSISKIASVENLLLNNNEMGVGPNSDDLKGFKNLKTLDLSYNGMWNIDTSAFAVCSSLTTINLSNNNITLIDDKNGFILCPNLTTLDVSHNSIFDLGKLKDISNKVKYNNQNVRLPYHYKNIDNSLTISMDAFNHLTDINGEKITSVNQLKGEDNFIIPTSITNNEFTVSNINFNSTVIKGFDKNNVQAFDIELGIDFFEEAANYVRNFDVKNSDENIIYDLYKNSYCTIKEEQISKLEANEPGITNKFINIKNIMSLMSYLPNGNINSLDNTEISLYIKLIQQFNSNQLELHFDKIDALISKIIEINSLKLENYSDGKNKQALKDIKDELDSIGITLNNREAMYTVKDINKFNSYKVTLKNLNTKVTEYLNIVIEKPTEGNAGESNDNNSNNTSNKLPSTGQETLPVGLMGAFLIALGYKLKKK
ncbi:MAG: NlpC/P60 family protein [Clostridium sp.]